MSTYNIAEFSKFELFAHLCSLYECEVVVLNHPSLSPEQEMVEDLLSIVHCFSSRLYGLRNYRRVLKEALAHDQGAQDPAEPNP